MTQTGALVSDAEPFSTRRRSSQVVVRISVLAALLLMAVYTAFGIQKLQTAPSLGGTPLAAESRIIAAKVDGRIAGQRAALAGAAELLERDPATPIDAAEAALRIAGKDALAAAVVADGQVLAELSGKTAREYSPKRHPSRRPPPSHRSACTDMRHVRGASGNR